jgi:POT family proton-dependent oligopeptide transporter
MPLAGAYMADQYWGRFRTIMFSIGAALLGHIILIVSALPPVISSPNGAIACFSIGLLIMGVGTGGFKYVFPPFPFALLKFNTDGTVGPISLP